MNKLSIATLLFVFLLSCSPKGKILQEEKATLPKGEYFGLTASTKAEIFAEGMVSREFQELNAVFSPDGDEFYFTLADPARTFYTILLYKKNKEQEWEGPMVAPFSGSYSDADPAFSSDGQRLYFISRRPTDLTSTEPKDFDIWVTHRIGDSWSQPTNLGAPINTEKDEYYVSVTDEESIVYSGNYEGKGFGYGDIYEARLDENNKYQVENLGAAINSEQGEGDPYISPDGKMLIFMSWGRSDGLGSGDLYISFKENGQWSIAKNLGTEINSKQFEYCPMLSPDGKYFFWTSYKSSPMHSPTPRDYEAYLQKLGSVDNGLGNVYWIDASVLKKSN